MENLNQINPNDYDKIIVAFSGGVKTVQHYFYIYLN